MAVYSNRSDDNQHLTISVTDSFQYSDRSGFLKCYEDCLDEVSGVSVDLREAVYLDSAACGMLLVLRDRAKNCKVELREIIINEEVKEFFDTMGLPSILNVILPD